VRLALAFAPWAGLAVAGLAAAAASSVLNRIEDATGGYRTGVPWSAAEPGGGIAEIGVFGVPWALLLLLAAITGAIATGSSIARGDGASGWLRLRRRRGQASPSAIAVGIVGALAAVALVHGASWAVRADRGPMSDALEGGLMSAPGPEVTAIHHDGLTWEGERPWQEVAVDR
jgi:hypothetical protein